MWRGVQRLDESVRRRNMPKKKFDTRRLARREQEVCARMGVSVQSKEKRTNKRECVRVCVPTREKKAREGRRNSNGPIAAVTPDPVETSRVLWRAVHKVPSVHKLGAVSLVPRADKADPARERLHSGLESHPTSSTRGCHGVSGCSSGCSIWGGCAIVWASAS